MLLLPCSPRVHLHRLSPTRRLPLASPSPLPGRRLRRSTTIRAEAEAPPPPPPSSAAEPEPPDAGAVDVEGEGPVELRAPMLFSTDDNPTTLQTATSLLLTGAISIFLFRSLRRRARRAKELVMPLLIPSSLSVLPHALSDRELMRFLAWLIRCRRGCGRAG
jgi:hypothetical protein